MRDGLIPDSPARSPNAYVTLVTNAPYVVGARALIRSIRASGTEADCVVMHTPAIGPRDRAVLAAEGARLICIDLLPTSHRFNAAHAREAVHAAAPFLKGAKPPFHTPLDNFAKLRLWQLIEYDRVVFVDADAILLRNCDRLFDYPEFAAAPNVYEGLADFHRLNSGVFVARPSLDTYGRMLAHLDQPGRFWRRTDQTFLQDFFPDWHGLPVFYNMLQYVWLNMPALWDWQAIHILHFQYEKPWQTDHDKAEALAPLIALWQQFAADGALPRVDLSGLPQPVAA